MTLLGAQHYDTTSSARTSFKRVIDGAVRGSSVTVRGIVTGRRTGGARAPTVDLTVPVRALSALPA